MLQLEEVDPMGDLKQPMDNLKEPMMDNSSSLSASPAVAASSSRPCTQSKCGRCCGWCAIVLSIFLIGMCSVVVSFIQNNDAPPKVADPQYPDNVLNYGIWWFGKDNKKSPADPSVPNPYFKDDLTKVVIFAHGWAINSHATRSRESFNWFENQPKYGLDINTANAWIDDGWNVGLFYWDQLADEPAVGDAETKIWNSNNENAHNMRWRCINGSFSEVGAPNVSVSELFYDAYVAAMTPWAAKQKNITEIRVAGHSLGNQLATLLTHKVSDAVLAGAIHPSLKVKRLALLDPFYSLGSKSYLNGSTVVKEILKKAKELRRRTTAIEIYKTSFATNPPFGDSALELKDISSYSYRAPGFSSVLDFGSRHMSSQNLYFMSYLPRHQNVTDLLFDGNVQRQTVPTARASTEFIINDMQQATYHMQVKGSDTQTTQDDGFQQLRNQSYGVVLLNLEASAVTVFVLFVCAILVSCHQTKRTTSDSIIGSQEPRTLPQLTLGSTSFLLVMNTLPVLLFTLILTIAFIMGVSANGALFTRVAVINLLVGAWILRPVLMYFCMLDSAQRSHESLALLSRFDHEYSNLLSNQLGMDDVGFIDFVWISIKHPCFVYLVALATLLVDSLPFNNSLSAADGIGWTLMIIGISLESASDGTLITHIKHNPDQHTVIIKRRVWSIVQNPQLLGEWIFIIGMGITTTGAIAGAAFDPYFKWFIFISPLVVTLSLYARVSRLHQARKHEIRYLPQGIMKSEVDYTKNTSLLVPLPPPVHRCCYKIGECFSARVTFCKIVALIAIVSIITVVFTIHYLKTLFDGFETA